MDSSRVPPILTNLTVLARVTRFYGRPNAAGLTPSCPTVSASAAPTPRWCFSAAENGRCARISPHDRRPLATRCAAGVSVKLDSADRPISGDQNLRKSLTTREVLERETRLELATSTLARLRSTN